MSDTKSTQHFRSMEGKTYQIGRIKVAFKRSEGEGEGSYSIVESTEAPGAGAGLHRHPSYQETFIVCEGRYDFEVAGERRSLEAGDVLVIPRGAAHRFTCTSPEAGRLMTISTPAGAFEAFIAEVCAANIDTGGPSGGPAVDMRAIAARHGVEFL